MVLLPWHISSEETRSRDDVIVRDAIIISGVGDGGPRTAEELIAQSLTIDELMQTEQVKTANLQRAHVLSLRLYSTSTYASMNNPLRTTPPTKPHPLAVTTYFASEGIKLLRSVAGNLPNAHEPQDFWRGMKDLTISAEFLKSGGTEFACMSTSTSQETAIDFAESKAPMIIKLETKDFMSRGADISFLSVYPGESETLFPPLTFLRPIGSENLLSRFSLMVQQWRVCASVSTWRLDYCSTAPLTIRRI